MKENYECYLSKRPNDTFCIIFKGMPLCDFFDFNRVILISKQLKVTPEAIWFNGKFENLQNK